MSSETIKNHASFIWSIADILRGDYKQSEYGKVILPLTVLRRLDCVLEPTKTQVLAKEKSLKGKVENVEPVLCAVSKEQFYNTSKLEMRLLLDDSKNLAANLRSYISSFSSGARDVLEKFDFDAQINRLDKANLLYMVVSKFVEIDLHPDKVSNLEMGYLYEELIRKFSELSNETAGEHFTPREVIRLMVNLLFIEDDDSLSKKGVVRTIFDPACGTGGMLSIAEDHLRKLNPNARLEVFGQELNDETYAICRSDMMLKGQDASHIASGNSLGKEDGHKEAIFDYCIANPPFGVDWKKVQKDVEEEANKFGLSGRYGAGLPRINDGSLLFLQHMISKMKPAKKGGSRIAVVFNGSPLFSGAAGSGESEIRRWIIENDLLEAVVALPDQLFYNTGIATYFWILTNRKSEARRGKVQLIDAREHYVKLRKSLGEKRKEISDDQIADITRLYGDFQPCEKVKIFENSEFGYQRITVERPLRVRFEVNAETINALKASKVYTALTETGWEDIESNQVSGVFDSILARVASQSWEKQEDAENALARATTETWSEMGWEIDNECHAMGIGAFADALGVKPIQSRQLLDCLKVRDESAPIVLTAKGISEPDSDLRDNENVPLPEGPITWVPDVSERLGTLPYRSRIDEYMGADVLPYFPDSWVDHEKTKIGYEILITRKFFQFTSPRPIVEIDAEIELIENELKSLRNAVSFETLLTTEFDRAPEFRRLRQLARIGTGHTPDRNKSDYWLNCTVPWVTASDLSGRSNPFEPLMDTEQKISELGVLNSSAVIHSAGTVMLCRTASIGLFCMIGIPMATTQAFVTWTPGPELDSHYLLFALASMEQEWKRLAFGSTHLTIYMPDLESIRIPYYPIDEQRRIAHQLLESSRVFVHTQDALERQSQLLKERNSALIALSMGAKL
jgi:type I restriction enzyme M protein